jgi:hypothetical protein
MAYKIPVGGVFASVYYDYEPAFRVYGDAYINPNYYLNINKILGQGIKITRWSVNNQVTVIPGINSVEATVSTDGPVAGTLSFDIEATGDIDFIQTVMGTVRQSQNPITSNGNAVIQGNGSVVEYVKGMVPKSMVMVIYIPNDQDYPGNAGDCFVLKGVVPTSAAFSIEQGTTPLHIRLECAYATEVDFGIVDIPPEDPNYEDVFNFSEAIAYFYNPGSNLETASFNSFETIIQKLDFTISHGGELLPGLTTRVAQERWYKNLLYDPVNMTAVYREKERFTEKFYGDKYGPLSSGVVAPFKRVLLVLHNNKFCSTYHRRLEFEFNYVKADSLEKTVSSDSVITEQLTFKPLNCIIRSYHNVTPVPEFDVSPYHVIQGDLVTYRGTMFTPGELLNVYIDGKFRTAIQINLSGGAEYRTIATGTNGWTVGEHTITAYSTGSGFTGPISTTAYATGTTGFIPKITTCPGNTAYTGSPYTFILSGYGFDTSSVVTFYPSVGAITSGNTATVTGSTFIKTVTLSVGAYSGEVVITASEISSMAGGVIQAHESFNITNVTNPVIGRFTATGLESDTKTGVYLLTSSIANVNSGYSGLLNPPIILDSIYGLYTGASYAGADGSATVNGLTSYRLGSIVYQLGASVGGATTGTVTFIQSLIQGDLVAQGSFSTSGGNPIK